MNGYSEDDIDNSENERLKQQLDQTDFISEYNNLPKELYHYCSYDTFKKIIENKTWRFASINGTNDISENLNLYVKKMLLDKNLFTNTSKKVKKEIINYIENEYYYNERKFFIACFSSKRDDLGQWRAPYGDNGQGICIGINPNFFTKSNYFLNKDLLGWVHVCYDIKEQKKRLQNILNKYQDSSNDDFGMDNSIELAWDIRDIALTMKHRAFNIEHSTLKMNVEW